jgi:hypothetical protein
VEKNVTNVDNFKNDFLHRTIFRFYENEEFSSAQKLAFHLRHKIHYSGSVSSVFKILKSIVFKYRKPRKEINFLWEEETL